MTLRRLAIRALRPSLAVSLVALLALAACGDDDDSGASAAQTKCHALCDRQGEATGCSPAFDTAFCKQLCDGLTSKFSGDCVPAAEAYYDCGSKQSWTCVGGNVLTKPTDQSCDQLSATYNDLCISPPK